MPWTTATTRATGFSVTATVWNSEHVDNMNFLKEIARATQTSDVAITGTTVGTANQIVSLGAVTYEAVPTLLEFFCPRYIAAAGTSNVIIRDSTTVLGTLATIPTAEGGATLMLKYVLTPTAASHTYNVAGWSPTAASGTAKAGTGGATGDSTTYLPIMMRATRIPT